MKKLVFVISLSLGLTVLAVISGVNDILKPSSLPTPAFAATAVPGAKPFYEGKTITIIVSDLAGSGGDILARLLARYLPRHIPGNPTIIVQNMPGAGQTVGCNYVYAKAKPDGLTILLTSSSGPMNQRLGTKGVLYDMNRMPIFMGVATAIMCTVRSETGIRQPRDIISPKVELVRGSQNKSIGSAIDTDIAMQEILKVKQYRPIYGYDLEAAARLAYMRGETNMHCGDNLSYTSSSIQEMIRTRQAVPVFQGGVIDPEGKVTRHPAAPDVPTVEELYQQIHGIPPSGIAWEAFRDRLYARTFGKILAFPPETPLQRVREMEQASRDLIKEPEWAAESKRVTLEEIVPPVITIGEPIQKRVRDYMATKGDVPEWLEKWVTRPN